MLMPSAQNYDNDHHHHRGNGDNVNHENVDNEHHANMDNNGCNSLTGWQFENNDDHYGLTKESCRTLYWRFWLGKPGQRGVQIGFEKARALIWAFDARPPGYPMPHKAPGVMESDIEWYKASHVFTGPCLMRRPRTTIKWGCRSRWRENHAQPCICNDSLAEIQLQYAITVGL